jgi:hypothetical protein
VRVPGLWLPATDDSPVSYHRLCAGQVDEGGRSPTGWYGKESFIKGVSRPSRRVLQQPAPLIDGSGSCGQLTAVALKLNAPIFV